MDKFNVQVWIMGEEYWKNIRSELNRDDLLNYLGELNKLIDTDLLRTDNITRLFSALGYDSFIGTTFRIIENNRDKA